MPTFENKGDHLFVDIRGQYSLQFFLDCIASVAARCREESLYKVLIDIREVTGNPSIMDRFRLGVAVADTWRSTIQAAIVAPRLMVNRMTETVAFNRGGRIKVFFDTPEALRWLQTSG